MRWLWSFVVVAHGLIHLLGACKAFGLAELRQLSQPVSRAMGALWLLAALLLLATVVALFAWPRAYWLIGIAALITSQLAIASAWNDAKFGTLANVVLFFGVAYGYFTQGPQSFRAEYEAEVQRGLTRPVQAPIITEADLAPLPIPVQKYVRATGFLGRPRVQNYRLRFVGRIRSARDARWMPFAADQHSFADEPTRLFWLRATLLGFPMQVLHRLVGGHATMRVKALGAFTMVDATGPVMDKSEAVTLFNDMCILAPGSLLAPSITWEAVDTRSARARFTNGAQTISATLYFDAEGLLENFVSEDRSRSSSDGKTFTQLRFSTPVSDYRAYGPYRLASKGEARWHAPEGEFAYGEFQLVDIAYNVRP